MQFGRLLTRYIVWHFTRGFVDLWRVVENFLWFFYHFFSIPFLLGSLFAPLERIHENYTQSRDENELFENFVANILMRIIGAFLRLGISLIGLIVLFVALIIGIFALFVWPFLPFAVGIFFYWGLLAFV